MKGSGLIGPRNSIPSSPREFLLVIKWNELWAPADLTRKDMVACCPYLNWLSGCGQPAGWLGQVNYGPVRTEQSTGRRCLDGQRGTRMGASCLSMGPEQAQGSRTQKEHEIQFLWLSSCNCDLSLSLCVLGEVQIGQWSRGWYLGASNHLPVSQGQ
jgi:hypothetical protein